MIDTEESESAEALVEDERAQLHPLLEKILETDALPAPRRFVRGLWLPASSAMFIVKHPKLWSSVLWPALINVVLFTVSLGLFFWSGDSLFTDMWTRPLVEGVGSFLLAALWWLVYVLFMLLMIVSALLVVMVLGGVLASPFNDILSERTEAILIGGEPQMPDEPFWRGVLRSAASSGLVGVMYLGMLAPLLLLHLIPVIGSVLYTVLAAALGAFFVSLEYTDVLLERKEYALSDKLGAVWSDRALAMGFGLGTSMLLWIPFLNFVCVPIAVVSGTLVGLGAHAEKRGRHELLPPPAREPCDSPPRIEEAEPQGSPKTLGTPGDESAGDESA